MESDRFDIDIGSGNFTLDRLSGNGEIDMGSGKGSIFFCDKPNVDVIKHELDMGSGNLTLYYPEDGGLILSNDIGSGKIEIDGFDHKKTLTGSSQDGLNQFAMGNGGVYLDIDLGSGTVTIKDTKSYSAPEITSEFKVYPAKDNTIMSSYQQVTIITGTELESADIIGSGEFAESGILAEGGLTSGSDNTAQIITTSPTDEIPAEEAASEDVSQEAA